MSHAQNIFDDDQTENLDLFTKQGGYSQNVLRQIIKIFVTLTWTLESIKHKNRYFITFIVDNIKL